MSDPEYVPRPEEFLAHGEFLRRLALQLLRDEHQADDVVQEAWLVALRAPPRGVRNLRAWLGRVVRNLSLKRRRTETRLRTRHAQVPPPRSDDPAADTVARLEIDRLVVDAVRALDEPYRTVIVLRFFDGLRPAEIARRVGAPVKTVNTRLQRALQVLRGRLDAAHDGNRRTWTLALLPLVRPRPVSAAALLAGVATVGIVAVVLGGLWLQAHGTPSPERMEPARNRSEEPGGGVQKGAGKGNDIEAPPPIDVPSVHGLVIDQDTDRPVPNALVSVFDYRHGTVHRTRTDAGGRFRIPEMDRAGSACHLSVAADGYAKHTTRYLLPSKEPRVVRLGTGGVIRGRVVVAGTGGPVRAYRILAIRVLYEARSQWDPHEVLYHQLLPDELRVEAQLDVHDEAGAFEFRELSAGKYVLVAFGADYSPAFFNGGDKLDYHMGITVEEGQLVTGVKLPLLHGGAFRVRVTDLETGEPVHGVEFATVVDVMRKELAFPLAAASADARARYGLRAPIEADGRFASTELRLSKPGYADRVLSFAGQPEGHEFRVVMGRAATVRGRVHAGAALLLVARVADGSLVGSVTTDGTGAFTIEGLSPQEPMTLYCYDATLKRTLATIPLRLAPGEQRAIDIGGDTAAVFGTIRLRGDLAGSTLIAVDYEPDRRRIFYAGKDGAFRLEGVSPGRFELFFNLEDKANRPLYLTRRGELRKGESLRIDLDARFAVRGLVVDADTGKPIVDSDVELRFREAGTGNHTATRPSPDGKFLVYLPEHAHYELRCEADDYALLDAHRIDLTERETVDDLTVVLVPDRQDGTITLNVVDKETGARLDGGYSYQHSTSMAAGSFEGGRLVIDNCPLGTFRLVIETDEHVPQILRADITRKKKDVESKVALARADSVRVVSLEDGGVAARAGLAVGDVLVRYGDARVNNTDDLRAAIAKNDRHGTVVRLEVVRDGSPLRLSVPTGRLGIQAWNHRTR